MEGGGVGAVEPAAAGVLDGLGERLALGLTADDVDQAEVTALGAGPPVVEHVGRDGDDLASDGVARGPRCAMVTTDLSSMRLLRIFSKLPRNIQDCMVTMAA